MFKIIALSLFGLINIGCGGDEIQAFAYTPSATDSLPKSKAAANSLSFPWLENKKEYPLRTLVVGIPCPEGFGRKEIDLNSFGTYLRMLPLLPQGAKVMLYDGREKPYQAGAARVLNIDIGNRDLQQCADAVMRLKAEYHYSRKEYNKIHFNYTSGTRVAFDDWRKGKKPKVSGKNVSFSAATGKEDNSYPNFKKYLQNIYTFAGTASLEKELQKVASVKDIQIGDVFIKGGFPGHAIIVMDMAESTSGEKIFLLAQSYMPAQSIHILKNPNNGRISPWYSLKDGEQLVTPEWTFDAGTLKRFKD
jgi:hypothetical protein